MNSVTQILNIFNYYEELIYNRYAVGEINESTYEFYLNKLDEWRGEYVRQNRDIFFDEVDQQ